MLLKEQYQIFDLINSPKFCEPMSAVGIIFEIILYLIIHIIDNKLSLFILLLRVLIQYTYETHLGHLLLHFITLFRKQ